MRTTSNLLVIAGLVGWSSIAGATTYTANATNFASIFYKATGGDHVILSGDIGFLQLRNRTFAGGLTIDATQARFTDTFQMKKVTGVNFIGGTFGSATSATRYGQAVIIGGGSNISFDGSRFIGNGGGAGVNFNGTNDVAVRNSTFTSLNRGMSFTSLSNGLIDNNRFLQSSSDGVAIVDSHFVTATNNLCSGTVPRAGAHPDCIQLWSLYGNPVQSDIMIADNTALGATQGFTSFDPKRGGGLRISMLRNRVDSSYPQGIACYGCMDSLIADNVLTTLPGAQWKTRINVIGGFGNIVRDNSVNGVIENPSQSSRSLSTFAAFSDDLSGAMSDDMLMSSSAALSVVPEPTVWLQLLAGMAAIGVALRRRQQLA